MTDEQKFLTNKLRDALAAAPDCLSAVELERLADNPAIANAHLDSCARCQAELDLLLAFRSPEPLPGEGAAVAWIGSELERNLGQIRSGSEVRVEKGAEAGRISALNRMFSSIFSLRWLAGASAAVLLCSAALFYFRDARQPALRGDAGAGPSVYRSTEVQILTPLGEVSSLPPRMQWKAVEGAHSYRVVFEEVDHSVIDDLKTNDVSVTIPAAAARTLNLGKPLLWRVTALDAQGRVLAISQNQRLSLHANPERRLP
jgi:hypothetical protein